MQVFHGPRWRGRAGGGSSFDAIRAQPHGTVRDGFESRAGRDHRCEVRHSGECSRNLESITAATLLTPGERLFVRGQRTRFAAAWIPSPQRRSRAYRAWCMGPMAFQGSSADDAVGGDCRAQDRVASCSRTNSERIEDLRANSWVFSWAQARVMLPVGMGRAGSAILCRHGLVA